MRCEFHLFSTLVWKLRISTKNHQLSDGTTLSIPFVAVTDGFCRSLAGEKRFPERRKMSRYFALKLWKQNKQNHVSKQAIFKVTPKKTLPPTRPTQDVFGSCLFWHRDSHPPKTGWEGINHLGGKIICSHICCSFCCSPLMNLFCFSLPKSILYDYLRCMICI